jgi:hypothetical protein
LGEPGTELNASTCYSNSQLFALACSGGSGSNPTVTLTTGTRVLVIVTAQIGTGGRWGSGGSVSFSLNGGDPSSADAVTFQPSTASNHGWGLHSASNMMQASTSTYLTVTPGANTFTLEYQSLGLGAASFANRTITVIPLD